MSTPANPETMMTAAELAARFFIHPEQLARIVRRGEIKPAAVTDSGITLFRDSQISELATILGKRAVRREGARFASDLAFKMLCDSAMKQILAKVAKRTKRQETQARKRKP